METQQKRSSKSLSKWMLRQKGKGLLKQLVSWLTSKKKKNQATHLSVTLSNLRFYLMRKLKWIFKNSIYNTSPYVVAGNQENFQVFNRSFTPLSIWMLYVYCKCLYLCYMLEEILDMGWKCHASWIFSKIKY